MDIARNPERGTNNLPFDVSMTRREMRDSEPGRRCTARYPAEYLLDFPDPSLVL